MSSQPLPATETQPTPPHVLQLIETGGPGGAEQVLINLAQALDREPAFQSSVGLLKDGWLAGQLRSRHLDTHIHRLDRVLDPGLIRRLVHDFRQRHVALVHAHEFTMNLYGGVAARWARLPAVATVHGKNYYADAGRRVWAMKLLPRLGVQIVAVSTDIQGFLEGELGVRPVRVIPNGIEVGRYQGSDRRAARERLLVPEDALVIGAVGNLYPVKGHATLLDAVARLGEERAHVCIAGRGEEEEPLRARAAELGIGDRVHLLGFRDDVPQLLAGFDIYALPSFSEGQSLALIEAMAAGLPIVASRVGGNPEIIEDGRSGLLFDAGAVPELAERLRQLLGDAGAAGALGDAARTRALEHFSVEAMVERYRELYAELGVGAERQETGP